MQNNNLYGKRWKDYFSLKNNQRNGFLFLFVILSIEVIVLFYVHFTGATEKAQNIDKYKADLDSFSIRRNPPTFPENDSLLKRNAKSDISKGELFPFDPNGLPVGDWKRLGFSEKQIHVIKNYESKGGKFRSKNDVKKIYSISEKEFNRIESFIVIKERRQQQQVKNIADSFSVSPLPFSDHFKTRPFLIVDVGAADTIELEKLNGIGPVKARIIYNYREKLGGFYSINQLKEAWGINDSLFSSLEPHLALKDSVIIRKMNVNTADIALLGKHPYVGFNLAKVIVNYRKEHGLFTTINDLHKIPLVTDHIYSKLAHYLKTED